MIMIAKNKLNGEIVKVNTNDERTLFICTRKLTNEEKIKNGFSIFQNIETDEVVHGEQNFIDKYILIDIIKLCFKI